MSPGYSDLMNFKITNVSDRLISPNLASNYSSLKVPSNAFYSWSSNIFFYVYYKYKLLLCRNMVVYAGVEEQPKLGRSREDLTEVSLPFSPLVSICPGSNASYFWPLLYFKLISCFSQFVYFIISLGKYW